MNSLPVPALPRDPGERPQGTRHDDADRGLYREECDRARAIVAAASLDDTVTSPRGSTMSLRWILVHMIDETVRHLGHADIMREAIDGATGD